MLFYTEWVKELSTADLLLYDDIASTMNSPD